MVAQKISQIVFADQNMEGKKHQLQRSETSFEYRAEEANRNSVRKPFTLFSSSSIEVGNLRRLTTASLVRDDPSVEDKKFFKKSRIFIHFL